MNNFIDIDSDRPLTLHVNLHQLFMLLDMLVLIIGICKSANYPEDLEQIYSILDEYIPNWLDKDWKLDI